MKLYSFYLVVMTIAGTVTQPRLSVAESNIQSRIFWQQDDTLSVRWADVLADEKGSLSIGPVNSVANFPTLDTEKQSLVQMKTAMGKIVVGVRDNDNGKFGSGWVVIDSGVDIESHDSHAHYHYSQSPRVVTSVINAEQGNPAHLYVYDQVFYLANDKKNGFTRLDLRSVNYSTSPEDVQKHVSFFEGGGGHITIAAVNEQLAFSTWTDRDGSNKGRVDLVDLSTPVYSATNAKMSEKSSVISSLYLANGGLHGAHHLNGFVFLAPSEGVVWFEAPKTATAQVQDLKQNTASLGVVGGKELRTGSFLTYGRRCICTAGIGSDTRIVSFDTRKNPPAIELVKVELADDCRASGLEIVRPTGSGPLGFMMQSNAKDTEFVSDLIVVSFDENKDDRWGDSKIVTKISVGTAKPDGHGGAHVLAFDSDRKIIVWTEPGNGQIVTSLLSNLDSRSTHKVPGIPSKILAIGGASSDDH